MVEVGARAGSPGGQRRCARIPTGIAVSPACLCARAPGSFGRFYRRFPRGRRGGEAGRMGLGGMLNTSTSRETGRRRLSRARTGARAPAEVGGRAMAAWPSRRDDYTAAEGWIVSPSVPTGGGLARRELRLTTTVHRRARSREHEASARITR
jgi:hypothetical protein